MPTSIKVVASKQDIPNDPHEYYDCLVTRNFHFVTPEAQKNLKNLKVLVAGCGTAGGACIEPLARLGIMNFRLADNGEYELSNYNRQNANIEGLGVNKATFHKRELLGINPYCDVVDYPEGITPENCAELVKWADVIMDGVDVTASPAIQMKLLLHEWAKREKKPTLSSLDLGFRQWGTTFDYRNDWVEPLNGKIEACRKAKHPIKALFTMFPLDAVPDHALQLVYDVMENADRPASQLGAASDLLAGVMSAAMVRFASSGELIPGWSVDLSYLAHSKPERLKTFLKARALRRKTKKLINEAP